MPRRPTGWTLALAVALPAEAATTLALPPALAGAVDAALDRDPGYSASVLLALVVGTAAAADALAAAAGPACATGRT
ncbi:hypothetical protein J5Y04_35215 [Kitasatospora sp. RG8]|uniref:hypothetical protein n=1 Tax=Kitasatospora sp. RG8 TaxID=2820815 RepID=UPI001AE03027|nr:hypothetical protein [Kitasatospora sp. RG8]MBP0454734.1 hypothetical protein [Kitasatospora sp. RG8]